MKLKLVVQIMDENGEVLAEHTSDPCQPSMWKALPGQKLIGDMPAQSSDVVNNGTYELHGITFQPHLRIERPNGWTAPPPGAPPKQNLPQGFPTSWPTKP